MSNRGPRTTQLVCPTCHGFAAHFMWCKHYLWPRQRKVGKG